MRFLSMRTSNGSMKPKSSGISSTATFLFWSRERNFFATLLRCEFSITKTTSAHSMRSPLTGVSQSAFVPALIASTPSYSEKTAAAVGLRRRLTFPRLVRAKVRPSMVPVLIQAAKHTEWPQQRYRVCSSFQLSDMVPRRYFLCIKRIQ